MSVTTHGRSVCIYYGGRRYTTSLDAAEIFLEQVLRLARAHESELVVLPHDGTVDLLLMSDDMPLAVGSAPSDGNADG